jgi:hypothetical protein
VRAGELTRCQLCLSVAGSFALLVIAGSLGGLPALAILIGALSALGIAAAVFGADTRDGSNW